MSELTNNQTVEAVNQMIAELRQAAKDGQLIQNGYAATEADGRATVADGETFKVQGSGFVAAYLYRRISASASQILASFPSSNIDSQAVNSGKNLPLKPVLRDGAISTASIQLNNFLLDLKIFNANQNYYYRFGYFGNGTSAFGGVNKDRIYIYKYKKNSYATASAREHCIDGDSLVADIPRDGGIHTRVLQSTIDPGLTAVITIDTSKITTAYGAPINFENASAASYSWIVDESNVVLKQTTEKFGLLSAGSVFYEFFSTNKELRYTYKSESRLYRITLGISNYNKIPNIKKVEWRIDNGYQTWQTAIETTGDWLPPLRIRALTGEVDAAELRYSGGNHGGGGSANGYRTARNLLFKIYADGQLLTNDSWGFCKQIDVSIVNGIRASNTIDSQPITYEGTVYNFTGATTDPVWIEGMIEPSSTIRRDVLHQCFNLKILPEILAVECKLKELEPVQIWEDNGPQTFTTGFDTSMMFAEGVQGARITFSTGIQSGRKIDAPKACAVSFNGLAGQEISWMDRTYGVGDGRFVDDESYFIRMGVGSNTKCYHAATMAALPYDIAGGYRIGDDYKWRGGWSWSDKYPESDFDTVFRIYKDTSDFAYILSNGSSMNIN